jgi:glycolate oxidase iron-sulfur subunit
MYQTLGLRQLAQRLGLVRLLPPRLRAMEALLPRLHPEMLRGGLPAFTPASGQRRSRVGLLAGCVQRVLFGEVNLATARVLSAEGSEVVAPPEQGCCGALELHAGYDERARQRARRLIGVFERVLRQAQRSPLETALARDERADLDAIVVNAAGCGSNMKQYGHLLRDDPEWAERAAAFSARVRDVSEVLAELEPVATYRPLPMRVAYHDACHLRHAQGIWSQPRQVLGRVPDLELLEIGESDICCGSAGVYNLLEPAAASDLGLRKARNILSTGAEAIATSNPGCLLQIQNALRQLGQPLPTFHPVELLDASIRGVRLKER